MKKVFLFATFMPWILIAVLIILRDATPMNIIVQYLALVWLLMSPLWFGLGCLIAYREGQWSVEKVHED